VRVVDSNSVTDIVYNYGTFDFDDDGFYVKFVRGKLLYYISIERFEDFVYSYRYYNRGITEQILDLTAEEKINIVHALNENLKPENKYYKYDFFLDNCTTRLRDIIVKYKHPTPVLPPVMPETTTFRQAIHLYLKMGGQLWSMLGIDILLGAPTDAVMTTGQQQFLPDNLMFALDSATNTRVVNSTAPLYPVNDTDQNSSWFTPMFFFCTLLFIFLIAGLSKKSSVRLILKGLDGTLFFLTGLLGVLIIFMMTGTDHSMTKENYNILWAWPTHAIAAFFINSRKKWARLYFMLTAVFLILLLISWFFLPQQMNNALIPLVLILIYRSATKFF
jgi:hypothetical protein